MLLTCLATLVACTGELGSALPNQELTNYTPILTDRSVLEKAVKFTAKRDLKAPSKIYYKDNFIFVSDQHRGIHIIDNTDPTNPIKTGFIEVLGAMDMAIKGNLLFVDNATDLISIDISDKANPVVKNRVKDVFPEPLPPDGLAIPEEYLKRNRPANTVLVSWVKAQ